MNFKLWKTFLPTVQGFSTFIFYLCMGYLKDNLKVKSDCWANFLLLHIFQKAQVTSNKMEPKKRHHFLAQFFMAFLVVWFVLFQLLAFGTIKWKLFIGWWKRPIRTDQPHARAQNIARKWFLRSILFKLKYILKDFSNQYRTPGWPLLSLILYFCSWFRTKDAAEPRWLLRLMHCWLLQILWSTSF